LTSGTANFFARIACGTRPGVAACVRAASRFDGGGEGGGGDIGGGEGGGGDIGGGEGGGGDIGGGEGSGGDIGGGEGSGGDIGGDFLCAYSDASKRSGGGACTTGFGASIARTAGDYSIGKTWTRTAATEARTGAYITCGGGYG